MEVTQIRYFLKAAETLNYTQAAEELFTSRQALCHTLNNLEKELGQCLFVNARNRLTLTKYGEYLLQAVREPLDCFDRMEQDVTRFFRNAATLRILFSSSLFPSLLPNIDPILQAFMLQHPHIALQIDHAPHDTVIDALGNGGTDCGIVLQMPRPQPDCSSTVLRSSDVIIGSGPDSPLFGKDKLTAEDLATVPLIGMGSPETFIKPLWEECQQKGITLDYRVVPDAYDARYQRVSSQASVFHTLLSNPNRLPMSIPNSTPRLTGYTWELVALCPKSQSNYDIAQLFASFLQEKYR